MTSLKKKYLPVLSGHERTLSVSESDIFLNQGELDIVLHDYNACLACEDTGKCRAFHGLRMYGERWYYDLYPKAMKKTKKLHFAIHKCPGPEKRKLMISERLTTKRTDIPAGFYEYAGKDADPFSVSR